MRSRTLSCTVTLVAILTMTAVCGPVYALRLISPDNEAVVDGTTPTLKWGRVSGAKVYELSVFDGETFKLVYQRYPQKTIHTVEDGFLKMGNTYTWTVNALKSLTKAAFDKSARGTFSCGAVTEAASSGEFKKEGNTLVVPVEFKDQKFNGDPVTVATKKLNEMVAYYRVISYESKETMDEVAFDVAPGTYLDVNRTVYSKDKKDSGGNWMRDCGDYGRSWQGAHQMKKAVLPQVYKAGADPSKYRHIIYIVPGTGGNNWGSDQFWPASTSGSPSGIRYDKRKDIVSGSYASGIVMGVGVSTGTYSHEFGHQLGLPDLYPYTSHPKRDLGYSALMAAGNQVGTKGVSMYLLSRKKSYSGTGKKKDWIKDRIKEVDSSETVWLESRTSKGQVVGLAIADTTTSNDDDHYVMEVFDRKSVDKDFVGYFEGPGGKKSKANVAVFISYVDNLDVNRLKVAQGRPVSKSRKQNFFLAGGEYKSGKVAIKIDEIKDLGDRWAAKVSISLDGKAPANTPKSPAGDLSEEEEKKEEDELKKKEAEELRKREEDKKRLIEELKRKQEEARLKREAEEKKKAEELRKKQDEEEQLKLDEEKQKRLEEDRKRIEEQERKRREKDEEDKRKKSGLFGDIVNFFNKIFGKK